ncbi:hypothetical protein GCM10010238_10240 [Streptomyces griseoviridis]|uniref:Uncharacterized protein n=1 Tax=Streptomyces griseoviridis TaxID=45398 RepID=A0A918G8U8_STRGD|nr:hypothetical protein GCM10010238_10240 [Streptomyces niveoruber]
MPDQCLAGLGQPHVALAADEQGGADGRLQGLHLLADGGLGAAQLAAGRREGTSGGHGTQYTEMTSLDHPTEDKRLFDPTAKNASTL